MWARRWEKPATQATALAASLPLTEGATCFLQDPEKQSPDRHLTLNCPNRHPSLPPRIAVPPVDLEPSLPSLLRDNIMFSFMKASWMGLSREGKRCDVRQDYGWRVEEKKNPKEFKVRRGLILTDPGCWE